MKASEAPVHVPDDNLQAVDRAAMSQRLRDAVDRTGGPTLISKRSGVPLSTLNGYLAGGEMKVSPMVAIANVCGVSVEWLTTGGGTVPPWHRKFVGVGSGISERQEPLRPPIIDTHWLAKAIEIVETLGGRDLPVKERAARIARSYEMLVAPEGDLAPLPQLPSKAP